MSRRSWFIAALAAIILGLTEATFVKLLPYPWHELKPVFAGCVLLIVLNKSKAAVLFAAVAGFMLDIFSLGDSAFALGRLAAIALFLSFVSDTVLTNRSVYSSVALVILARSLNWLWVSATSFAAYILFKGQITVEPGNLLLVTIGWDIVMVSSAFLLLAIFTRRFLVSVSSSRYYDSG